MTTIISYIYVSQSLTAERLKSEHFFRCDELRLVVMPTCDPTSHGPPQLKYHLQDHAFCALDLPVCEGVHHGGPIDADVVFIVESEELFHGELCVVVRDNGVRDSKAMDNVKEEQQGLLGFDRGDRSSLYPLCKLVYGDKQVRVAPGRSFEWSD